MNEVAKQELIEISPYDFSSPSTEGYYSLKDRFARKADGYRDGQYSFESRRFYNKEGSYTVFNIPTYRTSLDDAITKGYEMLEKLGFDREDFNLDGPVKESRDGGQYLNVKVRTLIERQAIKAERERQALEEKEMRDDYENYRLSQLTDRERTLNNLTQSEKDFIDRIEQTDPILAEQVLEGLVTFEEADELVRNGDLNYSMSESDKWARTAPNSYEVSTKGDSRFSALKAKFKPGTIIDGVDVSGMTIENVYQSVIKKSSKGKAPSKDSIINLDKVESDGTPSWIKGELGDRLPRNLWYKLYGIYGGNYEAVGEPVPEITKEDREDFSYYVGYLPLWQEWARQNPELIEELREKSKGKTLTDQFANTRVSQARALAYILNSETSTNQNTSTVTKIVSGGQTGVDTIGLQVAKSLGIETGGTAPKGFLRERGIDSEDISSYGLIEISDEQQADYTNRKGKTDPYTGRTELNVRNSDGTVYFSTDSDSAGKIATKRAANEFHKPFIENPTAEELRDWIDKNGIKTLNVAGNRGSKLNNGPEIANIIKEALTSHKSSSTSKETSQFNKLGTLDNPENFNTSQESEQLISSEKTILSNEELQYWNKQGVGKMPRILVGSERTDPAFHVNEILDILEGKTTVPEWGIVNGKRAVVNQVSGKDFAGLYLITKHDGLPMLKLLQTKIPKLIHFSITGLGGTKYEPGVMKYNDLLDRIEDYIKQGLDPNSVTIRIDPIVPGVTTKEDIENIVKRASTMGIKRIRFSIMDAYSNTKTAMSKLGYNFSTYYGNNFFANKEYIDDICNFMLSLKDKYDITLGTCAEAIAREGISKEGCLSVGAVNSMLGTSIEDKEQIIIIRESYVLVTVVK